ncbi:MAG: TetR/AcrR family transcriptional regulator [Alphaproteobacteria bacterium]|nr:TetR/AcrR family transcriptional regulator [Alphaproteobacteria bacterium]
MPVKPTNKTRAATRSAGPHRSHRPLVRAAVKNPELVRERQHRLVRAAMSVFLKKGFHDATVRDIGRKAGFTQGTIYNYVRSKDDILYLVCDEVVGAYHDAVHRVIAGIEDPARRLCAAVEATIHVMYAHQDHILLLYHESHALEGKALRAILTRVGEHIGFFEGLVDQAGASAAGTGRRLAANLLTFVPVMVVLRRWDLDPAADRLTLVRQLTDFVLRGLGLNSRGAD